VKRREFLGWIGAATISLPLIGRLKAPKKPANISIPKGRCGQVLVLRDTGPRWENYGQA